MARVMAASAMPGGASAGGRSDGGMAAHWPPLVTALLTSTSGPRRDCRRRSVRCGHRPADGLGLLARERRLRLPGLDRLGVDPRSGPGVEAADDEARAGL